MIGSLVSRLARAADLTNFGSWFYSENADGTGKNAPVHVALDPVTNALITPASKADIQAVIAALPALISGRVPVELDADNETGIARDASVLATNTALASILTKLGTKLSVSIDGDSVTLNLPGGLALDASLQQIVTALANQHADLVTLHGDVGSTLHADLGALLTKLAGLLTVDTVVKAAATSRSGTITVGGTAQQLMAANVNRRGFVIQNQSTGDLFVNGLAAAAADQNSLKIAAGDYYATDAHHVGTGAISIFGSTTGQAFYAREF